MPVARIVTHQKANESPSLMQLVEQLRASGYAVVVAQPGSSGAADVIVEMDEMPLQQALDIATRLSREDNADFYIAPGIFTAASPSPQDQAEDATRPSAHDRPGVQVHSPIQERSESPVVPGASGDVRVATEPGRVLGSTLDELGAALADGRAGIGDTISRTRVRLAENWAEFQQRRAESVQQRRLDRERRELEREQQHLEHEQELQRRAEEKQRLLAERERMAAEQERVLRKQMASDAAARAERERIEREAMAREAARLAEIAHAQEQERGRLAAVEAERQRKLREQEPAIPATVEAITRIPVAEPLATATSTTLPRPRVVRPARRLLTPRERQWQRAAFIASIAALAVMLGYAIAGNVNPSSPLPSSIMQNSAEQKVPFGPARVQAPAVSKTSTVVPNQSARTVSPKPSPAKAAPHQRARRARTSESDIVAEDEVIVRHAPTRNQRAQTQRGPTTAGVRRYSDEN